MAEPISGLGDIVATATKFIGITPCEKCKERQAKWNTLFPVKLKPRELTEDELNQWREYQSVRTLRLSQAQGEWLCKIYSDVFGVSMFKFCSTCSASPYLRMIERMDAIVSTYTE